MGRPDEERELVPRWIEAKRALSAEKLECLMRNFKCAGIVSMHSDDCFPADKAQENVQAESDEQCRET